MPSDIDTCWQALPPGVLPGQSDAVPLYRVTGDSGAQMRFDIVPARKLTPFVASLFNLALPPARDDTSRLSPQQKRQRTLELLTAL